MYELSDSVLEGIDLHDSSVDDWASLIGPASVVSGDFVVEDCIGCTRQPYHGSADLAVRAWLGWHRASARLYIAMERVDDVHLNDFTRGVFSDSRHNGYLSGHDGSLVFVVDASPRAETIPACEAGLSVRECAFAEVREMQSYAVLVETGDDGPRIQLGNLMAGWPLDAPFVEVGGGGFSERPRVSVLELYVTVFEELREEERESVRAVWRPDRPVWFSLEFSDWDDAGTKRRSGGGVHFLLDGFWGEGHLVPAGAQGIEVERDSVSDVAWARLKLRGGMLERR